MIDRVFTKAEARYIPNGAGSTADMAHPTRTGDVVAFSYPPYQFDAETPGTLVAPSHFFGQHGYVPDVQDLEANINMRATFLAGGKGIDKGKVKARSIDLAPTLAYLLGIPEPQHSQGRVLLDIVKGGNKVKPISIVGLNDFHGQLDPTTLAFDGINQPVGGAAYLATMFDEELAALPGPGLILAAGDNVGASPPNSVLLEDMPAIDVENAWGLDATSYGNHEFDYGVARLLMHQARANFPFLATNIVETATGKAPDWVTPSVVFRVNGVKVGVIGAELQNTPELVSAGATAGLTFLAEAPRIKAESERLRRQGVKVQIVVIHQGTDVGTNTVGNAAGVPWDGPILGIADALQDTTVDAMIVGHTHRVSNLMRGDILITEGINAGASYSVLQLMVKDGDVEWAGGATRVAKDHRRRPASRRRRRSSTTPTPRPAVLRNQVDRHPAQRHHPRPDPAPRVGDGQPGGRRDAGEVPRRRRGLHELRRPPRRTSSSRRRAPASSPARSPGARCSPSCRSATARRSSRSPAPSSRRRSSTGSRRSATRLRRSAPAGSRRSRASRSSSTATASTPVVDGIWKAPDGVDRDR